MSAHTLASICGTIATVIATPALSQDKDIQAAPSDAWAVCAATTLSDKTRSMNQSDLNKARLDAFVTGSQTYFSLSEGSNFEEDMAALKGGTPTNSQFIGIVRDSKDPKAPITVVVTRDHYSYTREEVGGAGIKLDDQGNFIQEIFPRPQQPGEVQISDVGDIRTARDIAQKFRSCIQARLQF